MSHIIMESKDLERACRNTIKCVLEARKDYDANLLKEIVERQHKFRKRFLLHKLFPATEKSAKNTEEWNWRGTEFLYGKQLEIAERLLIASQYGNPVTVSTKDLICLIMD